MIENTKSEEPPDIDPPITLLEYYNDKGQKCTEGYIDALEEFVLEMRQILFHPGNDVYAVPFSCKKVKEKLIELYNNKCEIKASARQIFQNADTNKLE